MITETMSEMLKLIKEERLNKSPQREKGKEDGEEDVGREREKVEESKL